MTKVYIMPCIAQLLTLDMSTDFGQNFRAFVCYFHVVYLEVASVLANINKYCHY